LGTKEVQGKGKVFSPLSSLRRRGSSRRKRKTADKGTIHYLDLSETIRGKNCWGKCREFSGEKKGTCGASKRKKEEERGDCQYKRILGAPGRSGGKNLF